MFTVSAILSVVTCGIVVKQYVKSNVLHETMVSVRHATRTLAISSETVVFLLLGTSAVSFNNKIDAWFIIITVVSCTIYRTLFTILQCSLLNVFRKQQFTFKEKIVLSYSGLRGAIAFGLALSLPDTIMAKNMFVTTATAVVFFTVIFQGITIKPLLLWLHVETKEERELRLIEDFNHKYMDYIGIGMEGVIGRKGINFLKLKFENMEKNFIKPILIRTYQKGQGNNHHVARACMKVTIQDGSEWIEAIQHPARDSDRN